MVTNTLEDDRHEEGFHVASLGQQHQQEHHRKLGLVHFQHYEFSETSLVGHALQVAVVSDVVTGRTSAHQFPLPGLSAGLVETPLPSQQEIHYVVVVEGASDDNQSAVLEVALDGGMYQAGMGAKV